MKKAILLIVLLTACSESSSVYHQLDRSYSIGTIGSHSFGVTEFTPKADKTMTCIAVTNHKGMGVSCFKKTANRKVRKIEKYTAVQTPEGIRYKLDKAEVK